MSVCSASAVLAFSFGLGIKKVSSKVRVAGDYAGSLAQTAAQAWRLIFFFKTNHEFSDPQKREHSRHPSTFRNYRISCTRTDLESYCSKNGVMDYNGI